MQKLPQLLHSFKKSDWNAFHSFSKSRYTTSSDLHLIYTYISKHRKQHNLQKITNEVLHQRLKPQLTKKSFDNIISRLCSHIAAYFIWDQAQKGENKERLLLSALKERGIYTQFDKKALMSIEKVSEIHSLRSPLNNQLIAHDYYFSESPTSELESDKLLNACVDNLATFTSRSAMFYKLELINRHSIKKEEWSDTILTLDRLIINQDELTAVLEDLIELQKEGNEELLTKSFKQVKNPKFSKEIRELIILQLTNHIWKQTRTGNYSHAEKLLQLYEINLQEKYADVEAKIPVSRFHNIIDSACAFNEYSWVEEFITNNGHKLDQKLIEPAKILAKAQVNFSAKFFDSVVEELSKLKFKNFHQELRAKSLLLRANFELEGNNFYFLKSQIDSFNRYVKRQKSQIGKTAFLGFQTLTKYMLRLAKKKDARLLLEDLKEEKYLIFRLWLVEKLEEEARLLDRTS